jgi:hypothetical protein
MQRVYQVTLLTLLFLAVASCRRERKIDTDLGPVNTCILFECTSHELRQRVRSTFDANEKGSMGRTALMNAAGVGLALSDRVWKRTGRPPRQADRSEYVRILLSAGANVNETDNLGSTALTAAIYNGDPEIVRLLLEANANPNSDTSIFTLESCSTSLR